MGERGTEASISCFRSRLCYARSFYALFLIPPLPVTICGQVRSGLWCLRVSVLVSQIAVAQRLGGILFPVKGWGEIWNSRTLCGIRAVFFVFAHEMIRN